MGFELGPVTLSQGPGQRQGWARARVNGQWSGSVARVRARVRVRVRVRVRDRV